MRLPSATWCLALLAAACSDTGSGTGSGTSSERKPDVEHLEARLPDGSSAVAAAIAERTVERVEFRAGLRGWLPHRAKLQAVESLADGAAAKHGWEGFLVEPADTRSEEEQARNQPLEFPQIRCETLDWDADLISALVVRAWYDRASEAQVYFRTEQDEAEQRQRAAERGAPGQPSYVFPAGQYVTASVRPTQGLGAWRFEVERHPKWRGRITALRLDLIQGHRSYVLDELSAVSRELAPGPSPMLVQGVPMDAGLIEVGFEAEQPADDASGARTQARRALPALGGQLLVLGSAAEGAAFDARRMADGLELRFSCALPPSTRAISGPVRFEVVALDGAGEVHRTLASLALDPARDAGRWHAGRARLDVTGEGDRKIGLCASGGVQPGRLAGLWGPLIAVPSSAPPARPSIVLVTSDTTRADFIGCYGATDAHTPGVDALAARGATFLDVLTACNATSPAHCSILSGLYVKDHGVVGNTSILPEEVETLAERLRAAGWVTIASSAARHLNAEHSGLGQGFDVYLNTPPPIPGAVSAARRELPPWVQPPAPRPKRDSYRDGWEVNRELAEVLAEFADRPIFLWAHYFDAHAPYEARPEFQALFPLDAEGSVVERPLVERLAEKRLGVLPYLRAWKDPAGKVTAFTPEEIALNFLGDHPYLEFIGDETSPERVRARYQAGIAETDAIVSELAGMLAAQRSLDQTVLVFTADHGESLGERDVWCDHQGIYDNTLRIPLVLAGPGLPRGARIATPVESVDIAPTILDLAGVPSLPLARGRSLVPLFEDPAGPGAPTRWFQHSGGVEAGFQSAELHAILSTLDHPRGTLNVPIERGALELYDRRGDQRLERDLAAAQQDAARSAAESIERWLGEKALDVRARQAELSDADQDGLAGLGYTEGREE